MAIDLGAARDGSISQYLRYSIAAPTALIAPWPELAGMKHDS